MLPACPQEHSRVKQKKSQDGGSEWRDRQRGTERKGREKHRRQKQAKADRKWSQPPLPTPPPTVELQVTTGMWMPNVELWRTHAHFHAQTHMCYCSLSCDSRVLPSRQSLPRCLLASFSFLLQVSNRKELIWMSTLPIKGGHTGKTECLEKVPPPDAPVGPGNTEISLSVSSHHLCCVV